MSAAKIFINLIVASALFLFVPPLFSPVSSAVEKERREPKFRFAFAVIRGGADAPRVEPVAKDSVLRSGDKLKAMIELERKCFVYLIHYNAQGDVAMLFPYSLKQFEADYQTARRYYVPKGDGWFQLDDKTGRETFYLIASDQRLLDVEFIYDRYVAAESSKKMELAVRMLAEIDGIRAQYRASSGQGELLARSEVPGRGFERAAGAEPVDIAGLANEVAFTNLFSETFIIEHR